MRLLRDSARSHGSAMKISLLQRLRQFLLLLVAFVVGFVALFQMFERVYAGFPSRYVILIAIIGVLFAVLWLLILLKHPYADQTVLACVCLLTLIGATLIIRVDKANNTSIGYRQLIWTCVALVLSCIFVLLLQDYRRLRQFSYVSMLVGIGLLLAPMLPIIGHSAGGARIWIRIGSYSMQPSEFAKLFLAFFFAAYLFDRRDKLSVGGSKFMGLQLPRWQDFGPIILVWALSMGVLVLQRDLGTSLMFFAMFLSMLYIATGRISWVLIGFIAFIAGSFVSIKLFAHVGYRVDAWLNPFNPVIYNRYPGGSSQLVSGLFGIASGGLFGVGLGNGHPELTPLSYSDFIYSALGEELGLVGLLAILLLYIIVVAAGFMTALRIKDGFGKLLSVGLVFTMGFQVFTVVGGITRVIPLTGLTLPYIAAGGSSLVANYLLAMIVIVLSSASNKPQDEQLILEHTQQFEALAALREKSLKEQKLAKEKHDKLLVQQAVGEHQVPQKEALSHAELELTQMVDPELVNPEKSHNDNVNSNNVAHRTSENGELESGELEHGNSAYTEKKQVEADNTEIDQAELKQLDSKNTLALTTAEKGNVQQSKNHAVWQNAGQEPEVETTEMISASLYGETLHGEKNKEAVESYGSLNSSQDSHATMVINRSEAHKDDNVTSKVGDERRESDDE